MKGNTCLYIYVCAYTHVFYIGVTSLISVFYIRIPKGKSDPYHRVSKGLTLIIFVTNTYIFLSGRLKLMYSRRAM